MKNRREIFGWAMYDFANSAFATSVLGVIYQVYFTKEVASDVHVFGRKIPGLSLWGYTISAAMLVIVLTAPALGAVADFLGRKKRFLFFYWMVSCSATALLYFVTPGRYLLGMFLIAVGLIGFTGGNAFYNAFLPEVADEGRMGRVSGLGQGLGYLGGGLCLLLNLLMLQAPSAFAIPDRDHLPVRVGMVAVAAWFALFAIPTFLFLKDRPPARKPPEGKRLLTAGYGQVLDTIRNVRRYPQLALFLLAFLFYMEGLETVVLMASAFGAKELKMSQEELVRCYLMIQAVGLVGALGFGTMADLLGNRRAIVVSLVIWCLLILGAYFVRTPGQFWVLGIGVGAVLGGTQACSRSLLGLMSPKGQRAEMFGFFAMAGKAASAVGPFVMAVMTQQFNERIAILSILFFFVVGLVLTLRIDEAKGIAEARQCMPA